LQAKQTSERLRVSDIACKQAPTKGVAASSRGFALVITLALLALLVLAVFALSALTKVNSQIAATAGHQTRARQNALVAFNVALGELQKHAGADERITAMAGVTGLAALSTNTTRHWCGVWNDTGSFVAWLASGAITTSSAEIQNGLTRVALVDAGSVGAAAANSEHVEVGKLPIVAVDPLTNSTATEGYYAYWVGDEGVKLSAYSPVAELAGVSLVLGSNPSTSATAKLRSALTNYAGKLPRMISYEQLSLLPTPAAALTPSVLQDSFHHTTLTAYRLVPHGVDVVRRSGLFNLNTNSVSAWRGLLETYNTTGAGPPLAAAAMGTSAITSLPARLANNLAAIGEAGKAVNGPFLSVAAFANSALLSNALTVSGSGVTPAELIAGLGPMLMVRSDTFRIRGYGEALNSADQATVQAVAWCEAIVQRVPEPAPNGLGRKFVVIYFRWLGPEDV
jgi:Tfp pilus assembly protein PilX